MASFVLKPVSFVYIQRHDFICIHTTPWRATRDCLLWIPDNIMGTRARSCDLVNKGNERVERVAFVFVLDLRLHTSAYKLVDGVHSASIGALYSESAAELSLLLAAG